MLLIAGGDADPQLRRMIDRAQVRGLPIKTLLHSDGGQLLLDWDVASGILRSDGERIDVTGAFVRQDVFRFLNTKKQIDRDDARSWKILIDGWLWSHPDIRLFNRSFAMKDAVNKPLALVWAREAGLSVPETVLHSSVSVAQAALDRAAVVYKPVGGGDMCRELDAEALGRVTQDYLPRPYIFQEKLVPPETRIFRVGETFFAFQIDADALDYRTVGGDAKVTEVEPPAHLLNGLRSLTDRLGLTYTAADFKTRAATGELIFLETNSNPMFAAFDVASGGRLVDAMLDWLSADHATT
jgi:hypothetical protein